MRVFLSYNSADKGLARKIGAHLVIVGVDVWFDEWEIQAGDSVPGRLDEGLKDFDVFVLLWSSAANKSQWVRQELNTAITRTIARGSGKIIPCKLDNTPLPPLIEDRHYVDMNDTQTGIDVLVGDITGVRTRRERLLAIQEAMDGMDISWQEHPATDPLVCCPQCGDEHSLKPWTAYDDKHDDEYWGLRCVNCGWFGGGER